MTEYATAQARPVVSIEDIGKFAGELAAVYAIEFHGAKAEIPLEVEVPHYRMRNEGDAHVRFYNPRTEQYCLCALSRAILEASASANVEFWKRELAMAVLRTFPDWAR